MLNFLNSSEYTKAAILVIVVAIIIIVLIHLTDKKFF